MNFNGTRQRSIWAPHVMQGNDDQACDYLIERSSTREWLGDDQGGRLHCMRAQRESSSSRE